MKVLILDDLDERHNGFKIKLSGHELTHVYTYYQAQDACKEKFDVMFLDHDLDARDGYDICSSSYTSRPYNGDDFCKWLVNYLNKDFWPAEIIIHSANAPGAHKMLETLQAAGIKTRYEMFRL